MASDGELLGRIRELERSVTARLAEQEEQLRALQGRSVPERGLSRFAYRVMRKSRRIPAGVERRVREAKRSSRMRSERPVVSAAEAQRRQAIIDGYLDPTTKPARSHDDSTGSVA